MRNRPLPVRVIAVDEAGLRCTIDKMHYTAIVDADTMTRTHLELTQVIVSAADGLNFVPPAGHWTRMLILH